MLESYIVSTDSGETQRALLKFWREGFGANQRYQRGHFQ
jgi:hypothetical protein